MTGDGDYPEVVGVCPACGWHSLFLGAGGFVTCNRAECPAPEAATDLLGLVPDAVSLAVSTSSLRQLQGLGAVRAAAAPPHEVDGDALPGRLRAAADVLRRRYRPPSVGMTPGDYLVHEGMRALADALAEVAEP